MDVFPGMHIKALYLNIIVEITFDLCFNFESTYAIYCLYATAQWHNSVYQVYM